MYWGKLLSHGESRENSRRKQLRLRWQCVMIKIFFSYCWYVSISDYFLLLQEALRGDAHQDNTSFVALDEDDFRMVVIENKLGCDMYLKKVEQISDAFELLPPDNSVSVWIPPTRYSDRLNVANESREPRRYAAVQIVEAKVFDLLISMSVVCCQWTLVTYEFSFCFSP